MPTCDGGRGFYHRLAPWYEAHYGLFTNQPAHTERGLAGSETESETRALLTRLRFDLQRITDDWLLEARPI